MTPEDREHIDEVKHTAMGLAAMLQTLPPAQAMTALTLLNALVVTALPLREGQTLDDAIDLIGRQAKQIATAIVQRGAFRP